MIYQPEGEQKVMEMLKKLEFKSEEETVEFLNHASTYLIINTMK